MADNILINAPTVVGGQTVASDDVGGIQHELVKLEFGSDGSATMVDAANPLPVTDAAVEAALASIAAEDFATQVTLAAVLAKISSDPATQTTLAAILAKIIAAPSTEAKQDTIITALATLLTISDFDTKTGSLTETAPATDTASSGLNGRLQRIAQRLTSLITALGSPFQAGGSIGNTSFASTVADAANVVEGALADAIVAAGAIGSISAKLRRATQGLEDLKTAIVLAAGTNLIGITQSKDLPDASATYALTNVTSTAYEASHVIKASAGYLFMVTGYNSRTSAQFIMISNTTSVPADAQTPVIIFIVPATSNFSFDLGKYGRYFSTGICIFNSSTSPTKTLGGNDCFFDCQFI